PAKPAVETFCEGFGHRRLAGAGDVFQEDMPPAEEAEGDLVDDLVLADDDGFDVFFQFPREGGGLFDFHIVLVPFVSVEGFSAKRRYYHYYIAFLSSCPVFLCKWPPAAK